MNKHRMPWCYKSNRPILECPWHETGSAQSEHEPQLITFSMQCQQCGAVSYGTKGSDGPTG